MEKFSRAAEQEPIEPIENLIESSLEHGIKFDEGQNAIVLEVSASDLDQEMREAFFGEEKLISNNEFVSKALRVFNAGHSEEEATQQIKAKDIIDSQTEDVKATLAKIPEIYTHQEITIHTEALKEKLSAAGIDVSSGKVGVLLMYRVQGVDFLNYLLREAIKRCPDEESQHSVAVEYAKSQLDTDNKGLSTEEIFKAASVAVGFESSDRLTLSPTNRDRLLVYLKKYGFVLDEKIIEKIERTTKVLNDNEFYHNDLTERNAMVEFDDDGNIVDVYLIDFEKSTDKEDEDFGGDMAIIGQYRSLTKTQEEEFQEKKDVTLLKIEKLRERVAKARSDEYDYLKSSIKEMLKMEGDEDMLSAEARAFQSASSLVSEQAWDLMAAILADIASEDPESVSSYSKRKRGDKKVNRAYANLLSRI